MLDCPKLYYEEGLLKHWPLAETVSKQARCYISLLQKVYILSLNQIYLLAHYSHYIAARTKPLHTFNQLQPHGVSSDRLRTLDISHMRNALPGGDINVHPNLNGLKVIGQFQSTNQLERNKKVRAAGKLYVSTHIYTSQGFDASSSIRIGIQASIVS